MRSHLCCLPPISTPPSHLTLPRPSGSPYPQGFLYVTHRPDVMNPKHGRIDTRQRQWTANVYDPRQHAQVSIGAYYCPEQAALAVSRYFGAERAWQLHAEHQESLERNQMPWMTAEEALAAARAEGLQLPPSETQGGYKGVSVDHRCTSGRAFEGRIKIGGHGQVYLGRFHTAEQAALMVAREAKRVAEASHNGVSTAGARWSDVVGGVHRTRRKAEEATSSSIPVKRRRRAMPRQR